MKYYALCGFGGILSCGLTHTAVVPLDLVKCRIQVSLYYIDIAVLLWYSVMFYLMPTAYTGSALNSPAYSPSPIVLNGVSI